MHMKIRLLPAAAVIASLSLLELGACSSDSTASTSEKESAGGKSGKAKTDAGVYGELGVTPPGDTTDDGNKTPTDFDYEKVSSPYADAAACKTFSSPDVPVGFHADERACLLRQLLSASAAM